jgi:predicted transcriptional regulator with HTH domain
MPTISDEKVEKISEQILFYLYGVFPKLVFTVDVARELARDEEFVKRLLLGLEKKGLVVRVGKNSNGVSYLKRMRWRISNRAHEVYSRA